MHLVFCSLFNSLCFVFTAEMDSGISLTDMIMEGFPPGGVSDNISPHNEIQARDEVPAVVKGIKKSSKIFTVTEDEMLVSAWLQSIKRYLLEKNT